MDAETPASIDKYEIVRELGRGATSTVYLAYDAFSERQVALKLMNSATLSDPEHGAVFRRLLANEASLAGRIIHPHIIGIYDASLAPDKSYIVMEYVPGKTLEAHDAPDTLLPVEQVVEIVFKCALALEFASRNGVIHRDIKPANIMLREDGEVKIADFGAALLVKSEQTQVLGVGSPSYMSPEQLRQETLNQQTDIYSLGVVLFRLLTGRLPFIAESQYALTHKILDEEPPPLRSVRPNLSPRLEAIVTRALKKPLNERYASWREFAKDLAHAAALDLPHETSSDTTRFEALRELPFFKDFTDVELWEVLRIGVWGRVPTGTYLMDEGDEGHFFFILIDGTVSIGKGTKSLGTQGAGTCFGEMCYIRQGQSRRTATVVATTPVTLLKIRPEALRNASENCQLRFNGAFLNILVDRLERADSELSAARSTG